MIECPVAKSSRRWMLRQERKDDRRLIDGIMENAVDVITMSEVNDDRAGQRREPTDLRKVARDRAVKLTHSCKLGPCRVERAY